MPYIHFNLKDLTKKDLNSTYLTLGNIRTPIYCTETKAPPRGASEAAGVGASQAERSEEEKKKKKKTAGSDFQRSKCLFTIHHIGAFETKNCN